MTKKDAIALFAESEHLLKTEPVPDQANFWDKTPNYTSPMMFFRDLVNALEEEETVTPAERPRFNEFMSDVSVSERLDKTPRPAGGVMEIWRELNASRHDVRNGLILQGLWRRTDRPESLEEPPKISRRAKKAGKVL